MEHIDNPMARPIRESWELCEVCGGTGEREICESCEVKDCDRCEFENVQYYDPCKNCNGLGYLVRYW